MTAVTPPAQVDRDNPWPGLSSYDEASREFFSGRRLEAEDLQRRILAEPMTVLFGKSGLGKTSLLKAGVFPGLREKGLFPVLIRFRLEPGGPPLMEQVRRRMFDEMRAQGVEHPELAESETLWDYLHRSALEFWTAQNRLVRPLLVFDQFEELFTLGRAVAVEVRRFREDLSDLVENRIPAAVTGRLGDRPASGPGLDERATACRVVLSLREDFLADLEEWRLSMPSLRRNRMRLLPMGRDQAFQAVYNERTRHLVSEPIARQIVAFLATAAGTDDDSTKLTVEPALLSLFCHGVNEQRKREGKSAFDDALIEGAKGTIVLDFYRRSVGNLPHVRRFIEEDLVTEQGFRNSYPIDSAIARKGIKRSELDDLINRHLLRHEHHLGVDRVELTHDLLTKAVVEERDARRQRERVRRWATIMAAACLVVMLGSGLVVAYFSEQARQAESRELLARAERELGSDPKRAVSLALEALGHNETREGRVALIDGAQFAWPEAILSASLLHGAPAAVSLTSDGSRLAVLAEGGTITVWDLGSPTTAAPVWPKEQVFEDATSVLFSPDRTLIAVGRERSVDLLHPITGSLARSLKTPDSHHDRRVGFSPDSRWLAVTGDAGLTLWDLLDQSDESDARNRVEGDFGGFALMTGDRIVVIRQDDFVLGAYAVERPPNGDWTTTKLDLSACVREPVSVSPGSVKYSATWGARGCRFTGNSDLQPDVVERPTQDIVWSTGGHAFVELLMPVGSSQDVIVGREYQSYRLENRIRTRELPSRNERSRLVSVSEDGRRAAVIHDDDGADGLVGVYSLADHKPFLSPYTRTWVALAPDASWIAFVKPHVDGEAALLTIVPLDEPFWRGEPSSPRVIELESLPTSISAVQDAVVVISRNQTTDLYDVVTGRPRFDPLIGEARPFGRERHLLFISSDTDRPSRIVRARDASEIVQSEDTFPPDATVVVSPAGEAIAVVREDSASTEMRATMYVLRGEALAQVGEITTTPSSWRDLDLEIADDGRSLIASESYLELTSDGFSERYTSQVWRVEDEPSGAPASGLGRYEVESPEQGKPGLNIVRTSDAKVVRTFPYAVQDTRRSSDGRWLAMWSDGRDNTEIEVFDLERFEVSLHVRIDAPSGPSDSNVEFEAGNRVMRFETNGNATLIPLDPALTDRFASWLARPLIASDAPASAPAQ